MNKKKEAGMVNFMQFHNDMAKIVEEYMIEVEIPAMRARRIIPLCYFGIAFGSFLMFLACV